MSVSVNTCLDHTAPSHDMGREEKPRERVERVSVPVNTCLDHTAPSHDMGREERPRERVERVNVPVNTCLDDTVPSIDMGKEEKPHSSQKHPLADWQLDNLLISYERKWGNGTKTEEGVLAIVLYCYDMRCSTKERVRRPVDIYIYEPRKSVSFLHECFQSPYMSSFQEQSVQLFSRLRRVFTVSCRPIADCIVGQNVPRVTAYH